jgi:hypothetical protein
MKNASSIMPNGDPSSSHAQVTHTLSKLDEIGLFGKVRSKRKNFHVEHFFI